MKKRNHLRRQERETERNTCKRRRRRLEKNRRVYLGVGFENVMDLRPDQLRGGAQVV